MFGGVFAVVLHARRSRCAADCRANTLLLHCSILTQIGEAPGPIRSSTYRNTCKRFPCVANGNEKALELSRQFAQCSS